MDKRVEVAWPILKDDLRIKVQNYIITCLRDTSKLRELQFDGEYTKPQGDFDAQIELIKESYQKSAEEAEKTLKSKKKKIGFFRRLFRRTP